MTAKEMFEQLGFKRPKKFEDEICYYKEWTGFVSFDLKNENCKTSLCVIDIPTIKAITQQMKELGWLDD